MRKDQIDENLQPSSASRPRCFRFRRFRFLRFAVASDTVGGRTTSGDGGQRFVRRFLLRQFRLTCLPGGRRTVCLVGVIAGLRSFTARMPIIGALLIVLTAGTWLVVLSLLVGIVVVVSVVVIVVVVVVVVVVIVVPVVVVVIVVTDLPYTLIDIGLYILEFVLLHTESLLQLVHDVAHPTFRVVFVAVDLLGKVVQPLVDV